MDGDGAKSAAQELSEEGFRVFPARLDVTDPLEVEAVVGEEVVGRCGRVDILVNNAGVTRDALVFKMSDED